MLRLKGKISRLKVFL